MKIVPLTPEDPLPDLEERLAALHALARIGHADVALPLLEKFVDMMEGELPAARLAHVRALVHHDPNGVAVVSTGFETMGADLLAAEAAADAAVAWRRAGEPRKTAPLERRAQDLAESSEGAVTPALQAPGARVHLTPAERRVALHRRDTAELVAEELRRLEPDEVYAETLRALAAGAGSSAL